MPRNPIPERERENVVLQHIKCVFFSNSLNWFENMYVILPGIITKIEKSHVKITLPKSIQLESSSCVDGFLFVGLLARIEDKQIPVLITPPTYRIWPPNNVLLQRATGTY